MSTLFICDFDPTLPPIAGDTAASIAVLPSEAAHVECKLPSITVHGFFPGIEETPDNMALVLRAGSQAHDSDGRQAPIVVPTNGRKITTRQVRPVVKGFIKRVVVPILIERYISQMNSDTLSARSGGVS